jgi:hypothetical protein
MNLRQLIDHGFSTANLAAGGEQDSPKWYAGKHQTLLMNEARLLAAACDQVNQDADLTAEGKARRRTELGKQALARITTGSQERFSGYIARKRDAAQKDLDTAVSGGNRSELRELLDLLREQQLQNALLQLDGGELMSELASAVRRDDRSTAQAIVNLPAVTLARKGIVKETIQATRQALQECVAPAASNQLREAQLAHEVVVQDLATVEKAIREHCGIEGDRRENIRQFGG